VGLMAESAGLQHRFAGQVNAPELPDGLDWTNTDRPLKLRDLRGRLVLLDFFTAG
jgi:hypothetical protein